jgi:DNA mismatch repair protein MutS2
MTFRVEQETLEALEWSEVVARLAEACRTARARSALLAVTRATGAEDSGDTPSPDATSFFATSLDAVRARLRETDEARALLDAGDPPPIGATPDIAPLLARAEKGALLEPAELLDVRGVVETLEAVTRHLTSPERAERAPGLADAAGVIEVPAGLSHEIGRCIDPNGEVRDAASAVLAEARRESVRLAADLKRRLEQYLQNPDVTEHLSDRYFTVRGDRYVLPVRADAKGHVRGIVHDASRSGTTLFIEPEGAIELNNRLKRAELEVQREILRILRRLGAEVADAAPALRAALDALDHLDRAFARGRLSQAMDAHPPVVAERGGFELRGLRHPLIDARESVPNDIRLGGDFQVLVLSGPNAGGKTVTLKALALAALFVRAGLHVPCEPGGRAELVEEVIAEIGDGQDIGESLSTFSAHMAGLARIVARAGPRSLVVLDEVGTGTDPGEGAALAQAILERLADDGARVITTTHFGLLKEMADVDPRFENASVEFDPETLAPTYRLHLGVPGASSAAAVASRMGMPSDVLARADALMRREDRQLDRMLAELAASRAALESERQHVAELRAQSESARNDYREKLERLQARRDALYQTMRKDLDAAFGQAHREVAAVIRDLQRGPSSRKAAAAREKLQTLQDEARVAEARAGVARAPDRPPDFTPVDWRHVRAGDVVRLAGGREGVLQSLPDRKGRATIRVGAAKLVVPAEQVGRASGRGGRRDDEGRVQVERAAPAPGPGDLGGGTVHCDLRGLSVEESLGRLRDALDRAVADGRDAVHIIHGHGTGALRRAVREHLADSPLVEDWRPGDDDEGGEGVTIAGVR